jgi:hypothetical protein
MAKPTLLDDALELAALLRPAWDAIDAELLASGVPLNEGDADKDADADKSADADKDADADKSADADKDIDWKAHARKHEVL